MSKAGALWKLGIKHGPKVAAAVAAARLYASTHPDLPAQARERLNTIIGKVSAAQSSPADAAKIRGMLDALRETARLEAEEGGTARAEEWTRRANRIERGVGLAEQLDGPRRRKALTDLKEQADALLADALDTMTGGA